MIKKKRTRKEKPVKESMVVFAFRLSEEDRATIHNAAGSGKATRFVRGAAIAAARGDIKAFDDLVEQAKVNRK